MKQDLRNGAPTRKRQSTLVVGWREMVMFPELSIGPIEAKVDTGARTSTLHATHIRQAEIDGLPVVQFRVYLNHKEPNVFSHVCAPLHDFRTIRNSGGEDSKRFVIRTPMRVGEIDFSAELTLADRSSMRYAMLLGRTALQGAGFLVDSNQTYLHHQLPLPSDD